MYIDPCIIPTHTHTTPTHTNPHTNHTHTYHTHTYQPHIPTTPTHTNTQLHTHTPIPADAKQMTSDNLSGLLSTADGMHHEEGRGKAVEAQHQAAAMRSQAWKHCLMSVAVMALEVVIVVSG